MLKIGLQVAELVGDGEIVGVVRGCMKWVGTGSGSTHVKMGCILGLRVSPKHRLAFSLPLSLKLHKLIMQPDEKISI